MVKIKSQFKILITYIKNVQQFETYKIKFKSKKLIQYTTALFYINTSSKKKHFAQPLEALE